MHLQHTCNILMGLLPLVASAHSSHDSISSSSSSRRALKWKARAQKREPLTIIQQIIQEPNIIIVQDNQAEVDALTQLAEQEFAALVEAQAALVTQLDTIKNNIRINHFLSRFSQANTVIVTVTTVVDARDANSAKDSEDSKKDKSTRYMVNQLLADNGKPDQQVTVMVSDVQTMTIGSAASATIGNVGGVVQASAVSTPTSTPSLSVADPNAPFGQQNQSVILAAGVSAPAIDLVFADPAAIILPGQANLFVESTDTFTQDCLFYQSNSNAFLNIVSQLFTSFAIGNANITKQTQLVAK